MPTYFKPKKTFADYVAIALCPLLIMLLVGSLAFFLLQIGYHGNYSDRVRGALFCFVVASVLISRISIEQGSAYANFYGLCLALAIGFFIHRMIPGKPYIFWGILAFIWWCTSKLTWDCTLIDDDADASGEGLLQAGGLQKNREATETTDEVEKSPEDQRRDKWRTKFEKRSRKSGKAHAPGVWVIYFSLAALPLFGLGQAVMQSYYTAERRYGFMLLWIYTAAALGLLLLTSFLGLRRYLRQRNLQMPGGVAFTWISVGTVLSAAILLLCIYLPRPDGVYDWGNLRNRVEDTFFGKASDKAPAGGQAGEGEGRRIGTDKTEKQALAKAEGAEKSKDKADGKVDGKDASKEGKGEAREGGNQAEKAGGQKEGSSGSSGGEKGNTASEQEMAGQTQPSLMEPPTTSASFWWVVAVVAAILLALAIWKRKAILAFLQGLLAFWQRLFGSRSVTAVDAVAETESRPRPFSDFSDPFSSGAEPEMSPDEILAYTYEALQAWAREHKFPHHIEDTPAEFSEGLALKFPVMAEELSAVSELYARVAYAGQKASLEELQPLQRLWRVMSESATGEVAPVTADAEVR